MNDFYGHRQPLRLSPEDIRFTQDSVAMCFQNGSDLNESCEEIVKGNIRVDSFPTIRVMLRGNDQYYSVDNRRLYIFRVLSILGRLPQIVVKKINWHNREITTENDGCHVKVRNRRDNNTQRWLRAETYRHCLCLQSHLKKLPKWWSETHQCHVSEIKIRLPNPVKNVARFPTVYSVDQDYSNTHRSICSSSSVQSFGDNTRLKNVPISFNEFYSKQVTTKQPSKVAQRSSTTASEVSHHSIKTPEIKSTSNLPSHGEHASFAINRFIRSLTNHTMDSESMNEADNVWRSSIRDNNKACESVRSNRRVSQASKERQNSFKQTNIPVVISQSPSVYGGDIDSSAISSCSCNRLSVHTNSTENANHHSNLPVLLKYNQFNQSYYTESSDSESSYKTDDFWRSSLRDNQRTFDSVRSNNHAYQKSNERQNSFKQTNIPVVISQPPSVYVTPSSARRPRSSSSSHRHFTDHSCHRTSLRMPQTYNYYRQGDDTESNTGNGGCCQTTFDFFLSIFPCFSRSKCSE